jgi:hypothetical protein
MDDIQQVLTFAKEQQDAKQLLRTQAETARIAAEANAAQALLALAQAQAAAATANSAALAAGAPAAGNVTFALSPALASSTLLNYKLGEGIKIYRKATAPLDVPFGGDFGALRLFLNKVQQRAMQFGWSTILQIYQAGQVYSFVKNYGLVTLESLKTQATVNEAANDRSTQNSSQMYTFLITSVTDGLLGKIISKKGGLHYGNRISRWSLPTEGNCNNLPCRHASSSGIHQTMPR